MAKKCLASWRRYCPDYEIIRWDEGNFDVNTVKYVRQAYANRKYAFVSDYVRLWVLFTYGGIYMDTDVEVLKCLDPFLVHDFFSGFESELCVPTGIMGACRGQNFVEELLEYYSNICFVKTDGSLLLWTNVGMITKKCLEYGFVPDGSFQVVHGMTIYPKEVFCPLSWDGKDERSTLDSYTIHHFANSWHSEAERNKLDSVRRRNRVAANPSRQYFLTCFDHPRSGDMPPW